ncbi:ribosome hibernation-promoting factor, HPF/YfiA family [Aquipuribacter sp. MA13-6]|uniref:ribosome hibernation-promoting factor, HPF/YfiA family n=1 Tax=unclassified Aquipuribacter TaxID=2635084 RepID=UPI003EEB1361
MDVTVTARHTTVPDRFRRHLEEKVEKVEQLCPQCHRIDAVVSEEKNPRQTSAAHRIELTVHSRGPVVRGEANAADPYAALDLALAKLYERLRRARDRRKVHHGRHAPESLTHASARWEGMDLEAPRELLPDGTGLNGTPDMATTPTQPVGDVDAAPDPGAEDVDPLDGSPVEIREKVHPAVPMTVEQALYEMELVGHDFYLFVDAADGRPSAMYRRKGWSYGVIRLSEDAGTAGEDDRDPDVPVVARAG